MIGHAMTMVAFNSSFIETFLETNLMNTLLHLGNPYIFWVVQYNLCCSVLKKMLIVYVDEIGQLPHCLS